MNLGRSAHPRPKGTGDQSMPVKREQGESANRTSRKTRTTWPKLHCLKSNPDRGTRTPAAKLTQHGVVTC
jgi:hypothetical protein